MKKSTVFTFLLLIVIVSFGQEKSTTKAYDKLLIGINISPDIGYRILTNNYTSSFSKTHLKDRNAYETPSFGYTTGININYNLSKRFGLEIGAQYSKKGYSTNKRELSWISATPGPGIIAPSGLVPNEQKDNYNYHYIDIPLRAIFSFGQSKLQFLASIGITTNILVKASNTTIYYYEDGTEKQFTYGGSDNSINFSPTVSAGIAYRMNDKLKLNIEPTYRYGLRSVVKSKMAENLWSAGLNITCYYTLK